MLERWKTKIKAGGGGGSQVAAAPFYWITADKR